MTPPAKQCEARLSYRQDDMARCAKLYSLPIETKPKFWPTESAMECRATLCEQTIPTLCEQAIPTHQRQTATVSAPSITRLVPEILLASGLQRNTTPLATSSAVPNLPVGLTLIVDS